jgi:nicotinamidase-related amidase
MHADSPVTALHERLKPQPGDIEVRKTRIGAFSTTDLDQRLRALGIDTLVLTGVHTSGVVLPTARDAVDRDYRVYVVSDARADPHQDVHEILTRKVLPVHTWVVTSDELTEILSA